MSILNRNDEETTVASVSSGGRATRRPAKVSSVRERHFAGPAFWATIWRGGGWLVLMWAYGAVAAPMAPNDPAVGENLILWLTDPGNTYDDGAGIWTDSSGRGNDAAIFNGEKNGVDFMPLELSQETSDEGLLAGQSLDALLTTPDDDGLRTPHLNDESGFSELTIVTLLRFGLEQSLNRPVGLGAFNDQDIRTHYNLAYDGSIRKDNGFVAGAEPAPFDFFVRGSVLNGDGIDNATIRDFYFDDRGSGFESIVNIDDEDFGFPETGDDRLYLGDLRTNSEGDAIAQVAFYNAALRDDQVKAIAEWMAQNPNGTSGAGPRLMAGDADQDLDFDQLDLVQVQIAAKYLTGQAATWGEGDWDAAPGGAPGSPPTGDGLFNQLDIITALSASIYLTGPYAAAATGGAAHDGQTLVASDLTVVGSLPGGAALGNVDLIDVPEPSTIILLLAGLWGIAWYRRHR